jgi:hypothetical protein
MDPSKRLLRLLALLLAGMSFTCAALAESSATAPSTQPDTGKFIRFVPQGDNSGVLELSTVSYRNAAGATVELIGAVHIADPSFYSALNQQFKSYDALLYEMVKPKNVAMADTPPPSGRRLSWVGRMQRFLQRSLDLQYQLDGIDYQAPNFVHADLDMETFTKLEEQKGESIPGVMLKQAVFEMGKEMADPQAADDDAADTAALLYALQSDDKPRAFKIFLARRIASASGDLGEMDSDESTVLISGRNHAAVDVLRQRLAMGDKRIGIFFGVGHLSGIEKIITEEMGFKQVGEPRWRIAWDMTHPTPKTVPATGPTIAPQKGPTTQPMPSALTREPG